MNNKTIRLVIPDWQGGDNPVYALGAKILKAIAPANDNQSTVTIDVPTEPTNLVKENGVTGQSIVKETLLKAKDALNQHNPAKVTTLGGNCQVSQAPIDYLNGQYDHLGVIWVDAHPDISTPDNYPNEHAMVLGNLLQKGDPVFNQLVDHPLKPEQIFYAGLQEPNAAEKVILPANGLEHQHHQGLSLTDVKAWVKENAIQHLYIHFDIDVLSPQHFYSTYFNNPQFTSKPHTAEGIATVPKTWRFLTDLNNQFDLVGLTIAEYMPWSAQQLASLMDNLKIFRQ